MGKACLIRNNVVRAKILEILKEEGTPLNTSQVCRLYHGAESKFHIKFCRPQKWDKRHDTEGFSRRGNNSLYENCHAHSPGYGVIYRALFKLVEKGHLDTRIETRSDPIVPTQKDRMRMWAFVGMLPSLDNFPIFDHSIKQKVDK